MSKLVFTADKTGVFDARLSTLGPNQIRIIFNDSVPDEFLIYSGFVIINEHNGIVEGDFTDYIYKYRDVEEPYIYEVSNNRMPYNPDMYTMPERGEIIYNTKEDQQKEVASFVYNKDSVSGIVDDKISELSEECKATIENGVGITINKELKHFSYSLEKGDQANVDDIFNSMMQTNAGQYYHADGETQQYFEPYQVFNIYSALKCNKLNTIAKYNQLALMLRNMFSQDKEYSDDDIEYLNQVSLRKTKLKGDFHKNYVANKTQNEDQMEAIKQKLIANGIEFPPEEKEAENATE